MTREIDSPYREKTEPIYTSIWNKLKQFPNGLSKGSRKPPTGSGSAAAALISASFGCFLMMVTHHLSDTSEAGEKIVWAIGSWIPGSHNPDPMWGNIGSYSGKETMLLVGWLVSWPILYFVWKNKRVKSRTTFFWLFTFLIAATAMSWHPLFPYLPLT